MKENHFIWLSSLVFIQGVLCSVNMLATRYSRTMMGKMLLEHLDAKNQPIDLAQWYLCNTSKFDDEVRRIFIQCDLDGESQTFLKNCDEKSDYVFTQMAHTLVKGFLGFFVSLTTINGLVLEYKLKFSVRAICCDRFSFSFCGTLRNIVA